MGRLKKNLLDRLADKFLVSDGCWEWTAATFPEGYAQITHDGKTLLAHRVMYELLVGPIPEGLTLDHLCHTNDLTCSGGDSCPHRRCVRPDHLEPATTAVNTRRSPHTQPSINAVKTHCPVGHEYTDENTYHDHPGHRRCRTCTLEQRRKRRLARDG